MTDSELLVVLVAQTWQVTLLILFVATINRWIGRSRPHLAHALWLVVLVKCITPPVWSSPSGLFCWLQPARETNQKALAVEFPSQSLSELLAETREFDLDDVADRSRRRESPSDVETDTAVTEFSRIRLHRDRQTFDFDVPSPIAANKLDWQRVFFGIWVLASLVVIAVAVVRWLRCWRMVRSAPRRECSELSNQLDSLAKQLGLRRRVRLIVTESRLGPAVIGLFRTTVLLPSLIVDRLAHRSPVAPRQECQKSLGSQSLETFESHSHDDSPVAERQGYGEQCYGSLAPILAHELLHIRRGDLWVGLLQTLAQAVWWCHPLVWWVNRITTREAERCCDEEVLAELGCDPAAYARALVDVLELKRELKPVPVFPGVRPVEVTSQRLERIMQLGQGCQRRTPWWCWLIAALAAAATWPGAAFVVTAEDDAPLVKTFDEAIDLDKEPKLGLAYRVRVLSGAEDDLRPLAQRLNEKLIEKPSTPVIVEHDALLRLLNEAQAFPRLLLNSYPVARSHGRKSVTIADTETYLEPAEVTATDGTTTIIEQTRERGWRLTMQPQSVGIESLRLRVDNSLTQLCKDANAKIRFPVTGEERLIPGLYIHSFNTTVELKHAQHVVFPITKVPNAESQDVMLVTMQASLVVLDDAPEQPEPTPTNVPGGPSIFRSVGVNSDAGVTGEVVLEEADAQSNTPNVDEPSENLKRTAFPEHIPEGNIAEIRVEGNRSVSTEKVLELIKSKPGEPIDGALLRKDVQAIYSSRQFYSVKPRFEKSDKGPILIFEVNEGLKLMQLEFEGNKRIKTAELAKLTGLRVGERLGHADNREAARKIVEHYQSKGFSQAKAHVKLHVKIEDNPIGQKVAGLGMVFVIDEGPKVSVSDVKFDAAGKKLELDSLGQLLWQHGSWFVVVRPEPGKKLIDERESPSRFRSNGSVTVTLSKTAQGFSSKDQIRILADEFNLWSDESGEQMRFGDEVLMEGSGFRAISNSLVLTLPRQSEGLASEPQMTATLRDDVQLQSKTNGGATELKAGIMMLYLNGTAMTQLKSDENGIVAVLRDPPTRDEALIRQGQDVLAMTKVEKLVTVNFDNVPLKEAIKQLAQSSGRNIVLEKPGLEEEEGLTLREPMALAVDGVSLSSALKLMLDPLNLGYRVDESGVIVVTSQQRLRGVAIVKTYAVADLAIPTPMRATLMLNRNARLADEIRATTETIEDRAKKSQPQLRELVDLITETCQPDSWSVKGGNGNIKADDSTLSLVVRQTRDVHNEIRDLLEQLRRLHNLQAAFHVETLTVSADFWQKVGKDFDDPNTADPPIPQPQDKPAPRNIARLTKKEAALLRSLSKIENAPKVTLFNGQELETFFGNETPTMRLALKPVVSADRTALRLQAAATKPDTELDFAKMPTFIVQDGHSLLLDVTDLYSVGQTSGVPILSKASGEAHLFKNTGQSDRRTLLLITGQAIVVEEEEVLKSPKAK